jgi:hypothetical protein
LWGCLGLSGRAAPLVGDLFARVMCGWWRGGSQTYLWPSDGFGAGDMIEAAVAGGYPRAYPHEYRHPILFLVDAVAVSELEHPILVINLNATVDVDGFDTTTGSTRGISRLGIASLLPVASSDARRCTTSASLGVDAATRQRAG